MHKCRTIHVFFKAENQKFHNKILCGTYNNYLVQHLPSLDVCQPLSLMFIKRCMYVVVMYKLCAKYGLGQSADFPAQTSDLSFAAQSSQCRIGCTMLRLQPTKCAKHGLAENLRISRDVLSSNCTQGSIQTWNKFSQSSQTGLGKGQQSLVDPKSCWP